MEYKETQNSILFKNEYEEEFLKLTKEFGVDAVSKAYSNDEFSIYFFSCIEDQDKINSLMNSLKKKTKCDIIENFYFLSFYFLKDRFCTNITHFVLTNLYVILFAS